MLSVILYPYFIYCLLFQRLSFHSFKELHFCVQLARLFSSYFCTTISELASRRYSQPHRIFLLPIRVVIKSLFTMSPVTTLHAIFRALATLHPQRHPNILRLFGTYALLSFLPSRADG